jgi:hypothetical protein
MDAAVSEDNRPKWALLIGINRYPSFAPRGQLSGCVNDVEVMRQALVNSFNFPENHVEVLTDGHATREGILTAMQELVERVGQDDVVVVHYSGHGSQMTDLEGDEPDGFDETIVPYDSGRDPYPNRDIKDDEIYLWLKDLTAKTSSVTLVFDCCHSGTITRDDFGGAVRWVEPDLRPASQLPPSPIPLAARGDLDHGRDAAGGGGWLPLGERYALISGCSRDEKSFEVEEPEGVRHGAMTFFLAQELSKARTGTTYRDIFEAMGPRVSARFPDQHPQLEGARDLEVFGSRRIETMRFAPVTMRSADRVILGLGAACGLTEGSQWAIHPAGTKEVAPGAEPLGVVAVTAVQAVISEGRLLRETEPGAVQPGMRAVEESHALETRMPVEVVAPAGKDVQALQDALDRSKVLRRAERCKYAKARVYLAAPRSKVAKGSPAPMLEALAEETWAVVGEDGQLLMPPHRRYEPGVVKLLVENLEKVARHRLLVDLQNETSGLRGKVGAVLLRKGDFSLEAPAPDVADGLPVLYEEENMAFRIVSQPDAPPLFVYLLDLGLTGRITLLYPPPGAEDSLLPGRTLEVGSQPGREIKLYFPDEFPFLVSDPSVEVGGIETVKVMVTTHPADFQTLLQGGTREGGHGPAGSLDAILASTFGGGGYADRDAKAPARGGGPQDWLALNLTFKLRRRMQSRSAAGGRGI